MITMYTVYIYYCYFFFFNDTATTEIYTLSLHDALPISSSASSRPSSAFARAASPLMRPSHRTTATGTRSPEIGKLPIDRKSTRLNSSHANISYAVFCLKKKKKQQRHTSRIKLYTPAPIN